MSTVMYGYSVKKDQWWPFFQQLRDHYLTHSISMAVARNLVNLAIKGDKEERVELFREHQEFSDSRENHVEIQLFDFGDRWIFRLLEAGYYFHNASTELMPFKAMTEPVFYDDRTDIPEENIKNREIAEKIDALISAKQYLMAYVIDQDTLFSILFEGANRANPTT